MHEKEYPVLEMTVPETQSPVTSPHAARRGRHCSETVRTVTPVHIVRTTIETSMDTLMPRLASASRKRTSATLSFEMYRVIM